MSQDREVDPFELRERSPNDESHFFEFEEVEREPWHEYFKLDRYDWNDPAFKKSNRGQFAYRVIPISQGYFMIVSPRDYKRMTEFPDGSPKKWHAHIEYCKQTGEVTKVYGRRGGREGEPKAVYAHRELIGCLFDPGIVDHMNGLGLDNRRGTKKEPVNLRYTSRSANSHNSIRKRTKPENRNLPTGVCRQGNGFIGQVCIRLSPEKVDTRRSQVFETPELAAQWYLDRIAELNEQRESWAHNPESVFWPDFPRIKESDTDFGIPF